MSRDRKITDAEFEVIEGPYRIGDEHRTRKRWLWTGTYDSQGVPLWYRPPARFWRWLRPALITLLLLGIPLIGLVGMIAAGK